MDSETLKRLGLAAAAALGVALILLAAGVFLISRSAFGLRLRQGVMPLALAGGFIAGFAILFDFPHGTPERPWYLDSSIKMPIVGIAMIGMVLAMARLIPRPMARLFMLVPLVLAQTLLIVRGLWLTSTPWDNWTYLSAFLAGTQAIYMLAMIPASREERLWLVGPLVMWASISVAAIFTMAWVDQSIGKMMILLAVLAGLACVTGILKPMRSIATGSGPFLAVAWCTLLTLVLHYNEALPLSVAILASCAPLAAAVAWIPALRKRPVICTVLALLVALGALIPALIIAAKNGPALE